MFNILFSKELQNYTFLRLYSKNNSYCQLNVLHMRMQRAQSVKKKGRYIYENQSDCLVLHLQDIRSKTMCDSATFLADSILVISVR